MLQVPVGRGGGPNSQKGSDGKFLNMAKIIQGWQFQRGSGPPVGLSPDLDLPMGIPRGNLIGKFDNVV